MAAIVDRMKLINGSGSYVNNIASRVKDSEADWDEAQGELPAISVFDGDAEAFPVSPNFSMATIHEMSVLIRGFCKQGTTAANARSLIKDIKTAIRQDLEWTVSNVKLAMQTREKRDGIVRNEESFEVEACEVEFTVQFITDTFNAELRS